MATSRELAAVVTALDTASIPPLLGSSTRDFIEALLVREAQEGEALADAERFVYGTRWPVEMLRRLAAANTRLIISARVTIDREREREASHIMQFHFSALRSLATAQDSEGGRYGTAGEAAPPNPRPSAMALRAAVVWSRIPFELKRVAAREALEASLSWLETQREALYVEARWVFQHAATEALRRMKRLRKRLQASEYSKAHAGNKMNSLPREANHPIFAQGGRRGGMRAAFAHLPLRSRSLASHLSARGSARASGAGGEGRGDGIAAAPYLRPRL